MLRVGARRQMVRRVVLGLAVVSAAAMMVLYNPALDPSRVYYGTDTRAFALLLGAWLAFVPERSMGPAHLLRLVRRQSAPAGAPRSDRAAGMTGSARSGAWSGGIVR